MIVGCDRAVFEGQCEYVWYCFVEGCFNDWGITGPRLEVRWLGAEVERLNVDDWRAFAGREEVVAVWRDGEDGGWRGMEIGGGIRRMSGAERR